MWGTLPLQRASMPEDWTGPMGDEEIEDLGCSDSEMRTAHWAEPLQPFQPQLGPGRTRRPKMNGTPRVKEILTSR